MADEHQWGPSYTWEQPPGTAQHPADPYAPSAPTPIPWAGGTSAVPNDPYAPYAQPAVDPRTGHAAYPPALPAVDTSYPEQAWYPGQQGPVMMQPVQVVYVPAQGWALTPATPRPDFTFGQAVKAFYQNYAMFDGRANKQEYWWVVLYQFLVHVLLLGGGIAISVTAPPPALSGPFSHPIGGLMIALSGLFFLVNLVPNIAIEVRRLHDQDQSGGMWFLRLVPYVGPIIMLVLMLMDSKPSAGRFDGPTPPADGR